MKKAVLVFTTLFILLSAISVTAAAEPAGETADPVPVRVLILPKFEIGEMTGDTPGEAQYYYEGFFEDADEYEIAGGMEGSVLYVKDGAALYITGMGKVNAGLSLAAVLADRRFDFSECFIISTGCAGGSVGNTVMGDVILATAAADYDLGHHADTREMATEREENWFHVDDYDSSAFKILNQELMEQVFELVKDIPLETTERTRAFMAEGFDGEEWAARDPEVRKGTAVSGDNYWKGHYHHKNAVLVAGTYGCPDPYAVTEMEDVAVAVAAERAGMLDRLIIIRDVVDMDVFMNGAYPEAIWDEEYAKSLDDSENLESADIFVTAMKNNYDVGKVIIDAILAGELKLEGSGEETAAKEAA